MGEAARGVVAMGEVARGVVAMGKAGGKGSSSNRNGGKECSSNGRGRGGAVAIGEMPVHIGMWTQMQWKMLRM